MPTLHVVNVFTALDGSEGNPLGVFLDGAAIPEALRQAVAADLGYSETVFVDDRISGRLEIYTPTQRLQLAGHPLVGTSWVLRREGAPIEVLRPPAGDVPTWVEGELTWIRGRAEWSPPFTYVQLGSAAEVAALTEAPDGMGDAYCWAWQDEAAGIVRARNFVPSHKIAEDQATGAATMVMVDRIGRPIVIHQGDGSVIEARPGPGGSSDVGGRVVLDAVRDYAVTVSA
ncbi:MAG: PhzF family phenazine biosynthesis protein [Chloroflexi bacterium]|nr:PhzF family phenazine biosynthesis protein [Chloroflexota bacterium]MDA1145011.1 PhzF family phenazine biosynthesis protein [Chloroflexota bacterium]